MRSVFTNNSDFKTKIRSIEIKRKSRLIDLFLLELLNICLSLIAELLYSKSTKVYKKINP